MNLWQSIELKKNWRWNKTSEIGWTGYTSSSGMIARAKWSWWRRRSRAARRHMCRGPFRRVTCHHKLRILDLSPRLDSKSSGLLLITEAFVHVNLFAELLQCFCSALTTSQGWTDIKLLFCQTAKKICELYVYGGSVQSRACSACAGCQCCLWCRYCRKHAGRISSKLP